MSKNSHHWTMAQFTKASTIALSMATTILLFQNCGPIQRPGVDNPSALLAAVSHDPIPASCASCHSADMPSGAFVGTASITNNLTPTGGLFDHSTSHVGSSDCIVCHSAVIANVGVSWAGGVFSHSPTPTSCSGCHTSAQRPVGSVGGFDHANGGTGDCIGCHGTVVANIGRTWSQTAFSHSPTPTACISCHAADANYLAIQTTITNQMYHTVTNLPDCVNCHATAASASSWSSWVAESVANGNSTARSSLGVFHAGFGSTPTSCLVCHANELPSGTVPDTSDGFNHLSTYGTECSTCHAVATANIGKNWTKGFFGHNGNNASSFTNCSPCHDSNKHHAGSKCTSCHRSVTWPTAKASGNYGGSFGPGD